MAIVLLDNLLTLGACILLFSKLRRTKDIFNMSQEIQNVGAFSILALGESVALFYASC